MRNNNHGQSLAESDADASWGEGYGQSWGEAASDANAGGWGTRHANMGGDCAYEIPESSDIDVYKGSLLPNDEKHLIAYAQLYANGVHMFFPSVHPPIWAGPDWTGFMFCVVYVCLMLHQVLMYCNLLL